MNRSTVAVLAVGIIVSNLAAGQASAPSTGGRPVQQINPGTQTGPQVNPGTRANPPAEPGDGSGMGNHGMMGGPGHGMMGGMMGGFGTRNIPDLTPDQRSKITAIRRDLRNRQLALMDQMHDQWAGTNYYRNGQFDEQAARRAYDATEKIHRQMFENSLDAQKRIDALLTPAQKQQLQRSYSGQP
jgi:Spy/CpxP family protein refolding chaperone